MASDLLNVGAQSVLTAQRQLNTTGHNISNVNTEGYSRQSVIQGTNMPRQYGGETYGMGVHVENVRRSWDQFAVKELNLATTDHSFKRDDEENLDMLSKLLSSVASKKIPENLNEWFDSVKTLADSPNDVGARKVVLEKAGLISQNMNDFHETVRRQFDVTNKGLDVGIERINQLAVEIRDLQRLMMRTPGPHNDLMDQHEKLVAELSQYTKVTVTPRKNAEGFNVHIGNGHTLVSGTEASQLKMIDGYPDIHQRRLAMVEGKGIKPITARDIGGKIGALMDMRDKHIPGLLDEIGRLATSFSFEVNKLQHQGLDLRGDIGSDIFTDVNSEVVARSRVVTSSNSEADLAVYIQDISQLKGGEYSLTYNGDDYIMTMPNGEQSKVAVERSHIDIDGMRIQINNEPKTGERVIIRPTRNGAATMRMAIDDASKIAAQSYEASTAFAQGSAKFNIDQAGDVKEFEAYVVQVKDSDGNPTGEMQVRVQDKTGKVLVTQPYTFEDNQEELTLTIPKQNSDGKETIFSLSRGAIADDKFTANLVPSDGDNGNLRKMINVQSDKNVDGKKSTIIDLYHNLNTDFGLKLSTASRLSDVARLEKESAESRIASVSGVNLDEEAANMMKFQQAYMASSRIIQAANDTFNTILALK
ncbi:flagellar hook-associated protein FlgK [Vibrio fluvialis]|nr:flagellar hook-associated protein FlgK [Vibrio fluvialis]